MLTAVIPKKGPRAIQNSISAEPQELICIPLAVGFMYELNVPKIPYALIASSVLTQKSCLLIFS